MSDETVQHGNCWLQYIGLYHNQFKSFHLCRSRDLRVDHMLYLLTEVVFVGYSQDDLKTSIAFERQRLYTSMAGTARTSKKLKVSAFPITLEVYSLFGSIHQQKLSKNKFDMF
ncbi:hypothetical protein EDC96DRAFT_539789 [Choanephora cucurbitarum]|nr:hypothetical protein EDC96DRAFT_539789 [Choanephora cucurbitarum]